MALTNDPQAYAKAILAEVKRQKTKGDDKQMQSLKRENDKLLSEVARLKEQTKVLQGESKKVGKLETKVASLTSDKNDQQRKIANLSRAVQGIKREYSKKFKESKSSGSDNAKVKSWIRSKGDIASFNKASANGESIVDSGLGNALGAKSILNREAFDKRLENKKEKNEKKKELTTDKINKSSDKLDKNFVGMDKTITAINRKLTLFGIALSAVKLGEWGVAKHEETKGNIHSAYSAGLNLQQGKEWIRLAQTMGNDPQALFGEMAQLKHQKDLTMRGATNVWTEQQQKFLFSSLPNSLNLNPNDWMRLSPQQLYKHIMQQAQGKIKEKPNEAGAILAGLKESGFSNLATMLEKAGIAGVELDKFQESLNMAIKEKPNEAGAILAGLKESGFSNLATMLEKAGIAGVELDKFQESLNMAVDVPRGMENATFEFSKSYQEAMARIDNATDRFVMDLMKISQPLLEFINGISYLKTSQEGTYTGNKITEKMANGGSLKDVAIADLKALNNGSDKEEFLRLANPLNWISDKNDITGRVADGFIASLNYDTDRRGQKDYLQDITHNSQILALAVKNNDEYLPTLQKKLSKNMKSYKFQLDNYSKSKNADPSMIAEAQAGLEYGMFMEDAMKRGDYGAMEAGISGIENIFGTKNNSSLLKYNEPNGKAERAYTLDELNKMSASNSAITQSVNNEKIGVGQNGIEVKGANSKIEVYVRSDEGLTTDISTMGSANNMVEVYNQ